MADLTIKSEEIRSALDRMLEEFRPKVEQEEVGRVITSGDGIARVSGLPGTLANELLEFPGDLIGIALNLEADQIGVVLLGDATHLGEGMPVRRTGDILSVPVGDAYLGRVVDPLGRPLDGKGPLDPSKLEGRRPLEVQAPSVVERQPVNEPLYTGIKSIDSLNNNIGRGQRQLLIGDRQTGKTAIAVDTILAQKPYWGTPQAVKCIYVAVGQKAGTVAEVVAALQEFGALEYTVVVNASAEDPGALKYVAPFAGSAIGQHWMYKGEHALIVYDDLSKQADAYRQISLLLRRPAGREAYPGDIFYLHSRLLERGAKLSDELGGGSLTALPIIETKEGDLGYIPLNVWSITDGQIFFDRDLFNRLQRPAVDDANSVSRVGGDAQIKAMKELMSPLSFALAVYRDLQAFALFAGELDKATRDQLARGERLTELLKQPQFKPMPPEHQIVSVFAGTQGFLDDIPVADVLRFETELIEYVGARAGNVFVELSSNGELSDSIKESLRQTISDFKAGFRASEAAPAAAEEGGTHMHDTEDAVTGKSYQREAESADSGS
jgi:F-type H+-transporting ATPase subunit alpha